MRNTYVFIFWAAALPLCAATATQTTQPLKSVAGEPNLTARTITYHAKDIVPISTAMFVQTVVILPKGEKILDVGVGDRDDWPISKTENVLYLKSAAPGGKTTINVFAASGTVYSFYATDVSNVSGAHPDAKVFVELGADLANVTKDGPKFVSIDELEAVKRQEQAAIDSSKTAQEAAAKAIDERTEAFRAQYPGKLQFDYTWDHKAGDQLGVVQIFHDSRFTYIKADSQELPVVFEIKDGKHSLINAPFENGTFTIQKIVDAGEIVVGKKKVEFRRQS